MLKSEIIKLLEAAGVVGPIDLTIPPQADMGDYAWACFNLAKTTGQNPAVVAKEIAEQITAKVQSLKSKVPLIERVSAFGPYVNFFLNAPAVVNAVVNAIESAGQNFGNNTWGTGHSVLIEYPSNNTHKEFHIGHFRNVCIGNPLVNLYKKSGYRVHSINYLNDFGAHVAHCLWALQKFHQQETPPANKQKWLGDIYVEARRYVKEHPESAAEVAALQVRLEARDPEIWELYETTRDWSIAKFEELFIELGVKHEAVFYEHNVKADAHQIVEELLQKNVAQTGEGGAVIIDLTAYGLDIALVRKSNGTGLYLTSDLPLAEAKFKQFDVDESIIITGQEQNFYFRQLYKILELLGFKQKLTHIGYGLVNTVNGKMSSRSGDVILYEDLRDEAVTALTAETQTRHPDWDPAKIASTARGLALAALKFDMQKHEAGKNFVFDIKSAVSFEGFTGPYVLYVIARINSLLRKAPSNGNTIEYGDTPEEKKLARHLSEYPAVITKALREYNPSVLVRYVFDGAQCFNDFYSKHSILDPANPALTRGRLALARATRDTLQNALTVLTIPTVEEM